MSNPADPLAELKDIYIPPDPMLWPPAPGWWILCLIALLTLIWLIKNAIKYYKLRLPVKLFLRDLQKIETGYDNRIQSIQKMSVLLRRLAVSKFGRETVSALHGQSWLNFLDSKNQKVKFSSSVGSVLAEKVYSDETSIDVNELKIFLKNWSKSLK